MEYMVSDLEAYEIDGHCFIRWRTRSDFEYQAETGDAVQIVSKSGRLYKGVVSDFNETGLYLKTSMRIGALQVHVMYEDIVNIELKERLIGDLDG